MATELETLRNDVYDNLNSNISDDSYPSDFIDRLLNEAQIYTLGNHTFYFLRKKSLFNTLIDTTLDGDVATTDTEIDLTSGTSYDNNTAIYCEEDIITYTGLTTNQLTGVLAISIAHDDGADVSPLYTLPSDFGRQEEMIIDGTVYDYIDDSDHINRTYWWTIEIKDGVRYIRIPEMNSSKIVVFKYFMIPTTMTSSVDCTLPDAWARELLPDIATGYALIRRDQPDEGESYLVKALGTSWRDNIFGGTYMKMLKFYKLQTKGFRKKFKSKYQLNKFNV